MKFDSDPNYPSPVPAVYWIDTARGFRSPV
jgi:hypothetical protein